MKKIWNKIKEYKDSLSIGMFQTVVEFKALAPVDSQSSKLGQLYSTTDFTIFFQRLFVFALSIGAIIAVTRLMWAGYLYMGQDMWGTKQKAKEIFSGVIFGLLLLLAIWLILRTINPQILNLDILSSIRTRPATGLVAPPSAQPTKGSCSGSTSYCDENTGQSLLPTTAP